MNEVKRKQSSTHYTAVLVRQAEALGLDVGQILNDTAVPREACETEDKFIDNQFLTALVKRLWLETGSESMGFDPTPLRLGTWAIACEFMLGANTLGELYRKGSRILSYLAPESAGVQIVEEGDEISIMPVVYSGGRDPEHFLVEFLTVVWHRFPSWVIDETIQLNRAFFSYSQPTHGDFYDELFQCEVAFDQPAIGFTFHRKYLQKPVTRSLAELKAWLHDSPADLMYLPGRESSVQAHLKAELRQVLDNSSIFPAFDSICGQLFMSPQVVRRRLAEEGTSYQKIKDAMRTDMAKNLLANPEMSVVDVAERTGFSEPAAFSRAFKKWTGITPAQFKKDSTQKI